MEFIMRLLSTLRPTQNQLRVIAKICAAKDFPARAAAEISSDTNLVAARNLLMKLNIITFTDDNAALTDIGEQVALEQNIIDDAGEMTEDGNKLAATESNGKPDEEMPAPMGEPPMGGMPPPPSPMGGEMPPMEGFSKLFKHILNG